MRVAQLRGGVVRGLTGSSVARAPTQPRNRGTEGPRNPYPRTTPLRNRATEQLRNHSSVSPHVKILTSIGRFILFIIASAALQAALQWFVIVVLHYQPSQGWNSSDLLLAEAIGFATVFAMTLIAARLEHRNTAAYGFPLRSAFGRRWWEGMLWGTLAPLATFGMIVAAGAASIDGLALNGAALAKSALTWLVVMILLGLFEELLIRGYPLQTLARGIGFWPAAILTSVIFGAVHYFTKPMENWVDATTVGLIGLFLCLTVRRTGDLWFAIGFHTAFDYVALNILGAPTPATKENRSPTTSSPRTSPAPIGSPAARAASKPARGCSP